MKTRFITLIALLMSAVMLLASCGGVPDEKITEVGDLYAAIGEDYTALVELCSANGLLEDAEFAQSISEYGTAVAEYGTEISETLEGMNEEEVDALIADLKEIGASLDEVIAICNDAINGEG